VLAVLIAYSLLYVFTILCVVAALGLLVPRPLAKDTPLPAERVQRDSSITTPETVLLPPTATTPLTLPTRQVPDSDETVPEPSATPADWPGDSGCTSPTRGPYLQSVTRDSIVIAWETCEELDSIVEYGTTQVYGSSAFGVRLTARHAVTLTGLSAYTVYHYRVKAGDVAWSSDGTFKTAAGPEQTSFSFAVIGDTHNGVYEFPRRKRDIDANHQHAVETISRLSPDFYLHVGDLVQEGGDRAAWSEFFATEGGLMKRVTMFPTLGNHERNDQNYFDLFYLPHNERWYSFDYGNAHFVCLEVDGYADTSLNSAQYRWLQNDLAETRQMWKFVFFHFPAYSSGGESGSDPDVQAFLVPLFRRYGVDIVFNGHEHNYQRNVADGVTYLQSSGGGGMTRPPGAFEWTIYSEETRYVLFIKVRGSRLRGVAIRPDGSRFDRFTLIAD
jgi:hypothetical protein